MTKRNQKATRYNAPTTTTTTTVEAPRNNSSDSENSENEDRSHSRTSTSSVESEQVKEVNGNGVGPTPAKESNGSFFTRVSSIPLIYDSVSSLHSYAKDNKYGRYALDTAGSAVVTVNKYTEPYQTRLQPHISKVDQLATKSLDIFENTFPIVTKPTAEIVTQVKKPIVYVEESSKNAYTQIQSTIDTRVTAPVKSVTNSISSTASSTVNSITSTAASTRDTITTRAASTRDQVAAVAISTRDTITTRAASTRDNITNAATSTATTIVTAANTHATPLVNGLETIVDRVLPAGVDSEKTPVGQSNQATRVVDLGRTLTRRVTRRVGVVVSPVTQTAHEYRVSVEKSPVVVKSKDQIHALNTRLTALLDSLRAHTKELQENVLAEVDSLSAYLKEHSPSLPESVQARIKPLVSFVNDRYVVVKTEIVKNDVSAVQKARNILNLTTEETLPILQSAAKDIRESLGQYQVKVQEGIHQGYVKLQDVNSSVQVAATHAFQNARYIVVGK
ncbi:hypothetical protein BGZ96_007790 [Linnemannia gamsii]|uniref:Uncharacterized protein n=1 Tax=Linnemannia gamsii TaxID=64522 RepID=A0ABQ7KFY7_9FUNG|nr:hypothetical protein BGZ96_007790 [Linnemannia gamsii]